MEDIKYLFKIYVYNAAESSLASVAGLASLNFRCFEITYSLWYCRMYSDISENKVGICNECRAINFQGCAEMQPQQNIKSIIAHIVLHKNSSILCSAYQKLLADMHKGTLYCIHIKT